MYGSSPAAPSATSATTPTIVSHGFGFCGTSSPHRRRLPRAFCPGQNLRRQPLVDDDDAAAFDALDVGEYPSVHEPHAERRDERTADPREIRAWWSRAARLHAFRGERPPLVSFERQIGDERRRSNARQRGRPTEQRLVEASHAGAVGYPARGSVDRGGEHAIGLEAAVGGHQRREASDEQAGSREQDARQHHRRDDECRLHRGGDAIPGVVRDASSWSVTARSCAVDAVTSGISANSMEVSDRDCRP